MILIEKNINDIKYILDESRLKEIELSNFLNTSKTMYNFSHDKIITHLPISFQIKMVNQQIRIVGCLNKKISYYIEMGNDIFIDALIDSINNDVGLHKNQDIQNICLQIQEQLYDSLVNLSNDFVLLNKDYDLFTAFVLTPNASIINIANNIKVNLDKNDIVFDIQNGIGTYLSYLSNEENLDTNFNFIILNKDNNVIYNSLVKIIKTYNQNLMVKKEKVLNSFNEEIVKKCQDVCEKYHNNYYEYFIKSR